MILLLQYFKSFVIGASVGWIMGSIVESIFHQYLGHANKKLRDIFKSIPGLGKWFKNAYEAHNVVHHTMTYKENQTIKFHSLDSQNKVDEEIKAKGINLQHIYTQEYGITLNFIGFLKFSIPFILVWFPFAFYLWSTQKIICVSSLLAMIIAPVFSTWLHPYLHVTHEIAIKQAPFPMNWIINSPYGRFLWVYHYLHHKNRATNFNLMLFGDFIRGYATIPTPLQIKTISALGGPQYIFF